MFKFTYSASLIVAVMGIIGHVWWLLGLATLINAGIGLYKEVNMK